MQKIYVCITFLIDLIRLIASVNSRSLIYFLSNSQDAYAQFSLITVRMIHARMEQLARMAMVALSVHVDR